MCSDAALVEWLSWSPVLDGCSRPVELLRWPPPVLLLEGAGELPVLESSAAVLESEGLPLLDVALPPVLLE